MPLFDPNAGPQQMPAGLAPGRNDARVDLLVKLLGLPADAGGGGTSQSELEDTYQDYAKNDPILQQQRQIQMAQAQLPLKQAMLQGQNQLANTAMQGQNQLEVEKAKEAAAQVAANTEFQRTQQLVGTPGVQDVQIGKAHIKGPQPIAPGGGKQAEATRENLITNLQNLQAAKSGSFFAHPFTRMGAAMPGGTSIDQQIQNAQQQLQAMGAKAPGQSPSAGAGYMYARDPQGILHRAPVGTPLPQGWSQQ